MRHLPTILVLLAAFALCSASAKDSLAQAKAEIANHKLFSAVPALQTVINAPDANQAQVEEAAILQSVVCAGLVIGAGLTMRGLAADTAESPFKTLVAGQLMTSRAGFAEAAGAYLNTTVLGAKLSQLQLKLPELSTESVQQMEAALTDPKKIGAMLANYGSNPAQAQGLLAAANHYGLYGVASDIGAVARGTAPEGVRAKLSGGVALSQLYYLDWLATAALKFHHLVKDPTGPDMLSLAQRCDERLKKVAGNDAGNKYVKQAQTRAREYK